MQKAMNKEINKEIERKFLVENQGDDGWRNAECSEIRQGYLSIDKHRTVRVRIAGDAAYMTIKGITKARRAPNTNTRFLSPMPARCWTRCACGR